jgi:hypothetical protein
MPSDPGGDGLLRGRAQAATSTATTATTIRPGHPTSNVRASVAGSSGGDRQANSALWPIVIVRMSSHPATRAYADRRSEEGLSEKEIIRCLKRYVAREVYRQLRDGA